MAKSLFEKLGLLVRSSVTDFVAEVGDRLPDLTLPRSGELDYEVDALRKRVSEALDYEDKLAADLAKLLGEIEETDVAADRAVAEGDDARARLLVTRLKRLQNRAAMLEHQLQQHRAAAAELMSQVNYLDSLVGDIEGRRQAERAQWVAQETEPPAAEVEAPRARLERPAPTQVEPPAPPRTVRIPVTGEEDAAPAPSPSEASAPPPASERPASEAAPAPAPAETAPPQPERYRLPPDMREPAAAEASPAAPDEATEDQKPALPEVKRLTAALRRARQQIEQAEQNMGAAQAWKAQSEPQQPEVPEIPDEGPSEDEVAKDLAARRSRLSKPE